MNTELQRRRVQEFQLQRERYLNARHLATPSTLAPDRQLVSTRHEILPLVFATPFAILAVAGLLDLLSLLTGNGIWSSISFALIPAGVVGGVAVAVAGAYDWFAAPTGARVRGVGAMFIIGTVFVVAIFARSWVARFGLSSDAGGLGAILGFMGATLALLTGGLLSEYLERLAELKPAEPTPVQFDRAVTRRDHPELIDQPHVAHG